MHLDDDRGRSDDAERDERELFALLRLVDHPAPRVAAETIVARARARGPVPARWAAGVILALSVAGAAYAVPGSPVGPWVRALVDREARRPASASVTSPPRARAAASAAASEPAVAGIAIAPGRALVIAFGVRQSVGGGFARVTLTDAGEVVVTAPAGAATFTADVGRLSVEVRGDSAAFEIRLPRAAPRVEIRVGGARVLLKEGARVTTASASPAAGAWALPLSPRP